VRRRTLPALAVAVLLLAAGCASGSDEPAAGTTGTASSSSSAGIASGEPNPAKEPVTVTVSITDGKVTPKPSRVKVPLGSTVELQITSDVDDEVHVHGFDVEKPLDAGVTTTVELQATEAGLYEVETHETELELLQLEVR
jgi:plastocyanin